MKINDLKFETQQLCFPNLIIKKGTRCHMESGIRKLESVIGILNLEPGIWNPEAVIWNRNLESGTWNLDWTLESGPWNLKSVES